MKLRPKCQRLGFKTPSAQLLRQHQRGFCVSKRPFEIHQRMPAEECRVMTDHLRPAMPDKSRSGDRSLGDRERASRVAGKPLREGHHWPVRYLDAAEAVPLAQFDAFPKPVMRADHPSTNVFGITETTEGHGL